MNYKKELEKFLSVKEQFSLGHLITEKSNPITANLSYLSQNDVKQAINVLKKADILAFEKLIKYLHKFNELKQHIAEAINDGGKIFICGCGATGRLALTLEMLWRKIYKGSKYETLCVGYMAGGDYGIARALENAEDSVKWAVRQTKELKFSKKDILIGCTEGGETPYVLACVEYAAQVSKHSPWLIYCNPNRLLLNIQRCARVINNPKVKTISMNIGPMSITGSTRLQACSVMMLALGECVLNINNDNHHIEHNVFEFIKTIKKIDYSFMTKFIILESEAYLNKHSVFYATNDFGVVILSDTAERSPTFNVKAFKNKYDKDSNTPCFCHLMILKTKNSLSAWKKILERIPRGLEWQCLKDKASHKTILGFDFSEKFYKTHKKKFKNIKHHVFEILQFKNKIKFTYDTYKKEIKYDFKYLLHCVVFLKMILNIHSNIVMGRLGRYKNNIMFWVKPSNYKLIDRCIRYIQLLCKQDKIKNISYEQIAHLVFYNMKTLQDNESIIFKVYDLIRNKIKYK